MIVRAKGELARLRRNYSPVASQTFQRLNTRVMAAGSSGKVGTTVASSNTIRSGGNRDFTWLTWPLKIPVLLAFLRIAWADADMNDDTKYGRESDDQGNPLESRTLRIKEHACCPFPASDPSARFLPMQGAVRVDIRAHARQERGVPWLSSTHRKLGLAVSETAIFSFLPPCLLFSIGFIQTGTLLTMPSGAKSVSSSEYSTEYRCFTPLTSISTSNQSRRPSS